MNVKILSIAAVAGLLIGSSAVLEARQGAAPGQRIQGGPAALLAQMTGQRDRDEIGRDRDDRFRRERDFRRQRDRDDETTGRGDRDDRFRRDRDRDDRLFNRDRDDRR
jgi:hypothetical protein